jgi:hypothetical protein
MNGERRKKKVNFCFPIQNFLALYCLATIFSLLLNNNETKYQKFFSCLYKKLKKIKLFLNI